MRGRGCVSGLLLVSAGAMAKAAPQASGSDAWRPAASSGIRYQSTPGGLGGDQGRFNIRPREPQAPHAPAGRPFDKAAVGSGLPQIPSDGRPTLNCLHSPRDRRCH